MHSKRVFHNFPSKCPEPKCQFQKIQSRGPLQIHPNSSQNSETLSDAPNHHSWSISYAFSSPNPDFQNLIFVRSGHSQPIPKSFTLAGTLPKPYFFQKNSRRPGVSNCQNLWTRLGTHLNLSLKAHSVVVLVYERTSRETKLKHSSGIQSCTELQRGNIFRSFVLQNKELGLYFLRCIDTSYVPGVHNKLELASQWPNLVFFATATVQATLSWSTFICIYAYTPRWCISSRDLRWLFYTIVLIKNRQQLRICIIN